MWYEIAYYIRSLVSLLCRTERFKRRRIILLESEVSPRNFVFVIPAKAGIQAFFKLFLLDASLRWHDTLMVSRQEYNQRYYHWSHNYLNLKHFFIKKRGDTSAPGIVKLREFPSIAGGLPMINYYNIIRHLALTWPFNYDRLYSAFRIRECISL